MKQPVTIASRWPVSASLAFAVAFIICNSPASAQSGAAASLDYSMVYAATAATGGNTSAADYDIVSLVRLNGVTGQVVSSESYSIVPLIGGAPSVTSAVSNWTLF